MGPKLKAHVEASDAQRFIPAAAANNLDSLDAILKVRPDLVAAPDGPDGERAACFRRCRTLIRTLARALAAALEKFIASLQSSCNPARGDRVGPGSAAIRVSNYCSATSRLKRAFSTARHAWQP